MSPESRSRASKRSTRRRAADARGEMSSRHRSEAETELPQAGPGGVKRLKKFGLFVTSIVALSRCRGRGGLRDAALAKLRGRRA